MLPGTDNIMATVQATQLLTSVAGVQRSAFQPSVAHDPRPSATRSPGPLLVACRADRTLARTVAPSTAVDLAKTPIAALFDPAGELAGHHQRRDELEALAGVVIHSGEPSAYALDCIASVRQRNRDVAGDVSFGAPAEYLEASASELPTLDSDRYVDVVQFPDLDS